MMNSANPHVFEFDDYKAFLNKALAPAGETRGLRSRLAAHLGCQSTFISQVLNGKIHLSVDHAYATAELIEMNAEEKKFFMLLFQLGRAGTQNLEKFYRAQLEEIREKRNNVRDRLQIKQNLSEIQQLTYYSAWYYSAIHVLLLIPEFQTISAISKRLQLSVKLVTETLFFLEEAGLAERHGSSFKTGTRRLHVGNDSPLIAQHHTNWRMQTIQSLSERTPDDLHYSLVMSVSKDVNDQIRALLLKSLEKTEPLIRDAKDEDLYYLGMDLFKI